MEYRALGASGLRVSRLCLGTMMFGERTDARVAAEIVASARDAGVNFIDTADVYAKGESERIVGRLVAEQRDHWVLATKAGNKTGEGINDRGLSRRYLHRAIDASLTRLGLDVIDLWYLHVDDYETPQEETLDAIGDAIAAGKVRYWGVSNFRAYRIVSLALKAREMGVPPPTACQPYYNAMNRMPEVEVLPACVEHGLGVVPYSPLARGVLTGKYAPGEAPPEGSRAGRQDQRMMETEFRPESLRIAQEIRARASVQGMTAGDWAVNWVLANRVVTSVLAGPRTLEQWQGYLGALGHRLDADDEAFLDALVPPGHPSTPGYSDPKYPIRGRVTGPSA
ncbi:MAG TPA: aldo/keto reductase [Pelomicrobium sp.]|nr:aldo/keto reductase [Pelomicrobium sp.]